MKTKFYTCIILLIAFRLNSQNITIRDLSTREPVRDVFLIDSKGNREATNNVGVANISALNKEGDIVVYHTSYQSYTLSTTEKTNDSEVGIVSKVATLDEVILTANKTKENKLDIPNTIHTIKQKDIEMANQPTSADLLQNTGAVFVQKSQLGGGSPVLRGFEANKVLIVVDGVRMNNAIYRGGHLQDVVTLDANMLERTEILFGTASTMYGSDALGGVMHFYTKNAEFSTSDKMLLKLNTMARYATVNKENTYHIDFNLGWKNFASMTNLSYSNFGDLMSGTNKLTGSPNSWDRVYYQERFGNRDSMVLNKNNNLQKGSAYNQLDFMQRFNIRSGNFIIHGINLQYSQSTDIPRYDRLTEYAGKTLRFAEWNYGPQKRLLASYSLNFNRKTVVSDNARLILAYQKIDQDRISRRFQNNNRTTQMEDVAVLSANLDVNKRMNPGQELRYGFEVQSNDVKSTANTTQIITGSVSPAATRYAAGGNKMNLLGLYLSHAWEVNKNFVITDGLRFSANSLKSQFTDTTFFKFPFKTAKQNNSAATWNLGFTWKEEDNYKVSLLAGSGFRTPNVDDMSKVFESAGGILIIPNNKIKPEYATNFEMNLSKIFDKRYKFDVALYYNAIENILVLDNDTYNGADSVVYNGKKSRVQSMQNKNKGYIYGFSAGTQMDFNRNLSFKALVNYTYGRYTDSKNDSVYVLDHIPPVFGQASLIYREKNVDGEFFVRFNSRKNPSEYSLSGEDNAVYSADPLKGYMPGWLTLNIRAGFNVTKNVRVNTAFENMTDNRYRVFASGINAPGKNFIVSLRYKL